MPVILWISISLMLLSVILSVKNRYKRLIGASGWAIFSIHWIQQPLHYGAIDDYVNVALTIMMSLFCLLIAHTMYVQYTNRYMPAKGEIDITYMATNAIAIGSMFYFPFAEIPVLKEWLIGTVTSNVMWTLGMLGIAAQRTGNMITYNGHTVEIILGCTAIESIALFIGLIASVSAPMKKLLSAFMVSVPIIYILNILRDVFVVVAYGEMWFGPNSFEIAHHMIAKAGSGIALFVIAYIVMRILPEILELIDGLWNMTTEKINKLMKKV
ncbi:MAG: archaeosortase A [Methanomethylovorans sp.]|uniref:archaeosortase A n=1 Tax=Methanomethylovorans sp. TaxID=2758717 RepID=UPI00345F0EED